MTRVLVVSADPGIPLYGPSGSSAHLRGMIRSFAGAGHEVVVAVPRLADARGASGDDVVPARVVTHTPRRWGIVPRRWRERGEGWDADRLVARALAEVHPELIYERHALWCVAGAAAQRRLGVPRIVELNAPLARERAQLGGLRDVAGAEARERASLRAATRVNAVSAWLARWAVEEAGCDPSRVAHVPNGVTWLGPGQRDATRQRLGLTGLVVGFVGSMKAWHGVDRIPAFLDHLPGATALVVGDGPIRLPEHPRLRAVGRVPPREVGDYVAAMDVALAPYRSDAPPWFCPLKLLEYRAQGVPIVAADVGDCAALAGPEGVALTTDDPAAWAAEITAAAARPRRPFVRSWDDVLAEALAR